MADPGSIRTIPATVETEPFTPTKGKPTGRIPHLTPLILVRIQAPQPQTVYRRRDRGEETLVEIGRSYNVSAATISRLTNSAI